MTAIKDIIKKLAQKGKITSEVEVQGTKFELRVISAEEQFLVETIAGLSGLKEKYDAKNEINSYPDTIGRMRNVSLLAFVINAIDGVEVIDEKLSKPEIFKKRLEFRDELMDLPTNMIDEILKGQRELVKKSNEFYADPKENLGK